MNEAQENEFFGVDAIEWLRRWDAGDNVWSIDMGGMGPGYEQCIQMMAAEILRSLIILNLDVKDWEDEEKWKRDGAAVEAMPNVKGIIDKLKPSGAQFGAAISLATQLYKKGPAAIMREEDIKDRHIQVNRDFP